MRQPAFDPTLDQDADTSFLSRRAARTGRSMGPQFDPSSGQLVDDNGIVIPENQWKGSWKKTWEDDKKYLDELSQKSFWDYAGIPLMAAAAFTGVGLAGALSGGGASSMAGVGPSTAANMAATEAALPGVMSGGSLAAGTGTAAAAGGSMGMLDTIKSVLGSDKLSGLADVFGNAAKSENNQQGLEDRLKLMLEDARLNRDKYALDAPGTRLATGAQAALSQNITPTTLDWGPNGFVPGAIAEGKASLPKYTGGLSGALSSMSGNKDYQALSNQVLHDQLVAQLQGGASGGNQDKAGLPTVGEGSGLGDVLGGMGLGTSILSTLLGKKKASVPLPTSMVGGA